MVDDVPPIALVDTDTDSSFSTPQNSGQGLFGCDCAAQMCGFNKTAVGPLRRTVQPIEISPARNQTFLLRF